MSHLLWKYFWENDVDKFRRLLASAGPNSQATARSPAVGVGTYLGASPGSIGTSPRTTTKPRKASGYAPGLGKGRDGSSGLSKAEVNSRDHAGLTLLLRASSSTDPNALAFVQALLDHPHIDLYAQDPESGWNALHRSLYAGNASIARALLAKECGDLINHALGAVNKVGQLIKTKDHEGNSPFDLYNSTIAARSLRHTMAQSLADDDSDIGDGDFDQVAAKFTHANKNYAEGDELFMFGSNKNLSLGVGDEDDRQYPERIMLQRSDQSIRRFYEDYLTKKHVDALLDVTTDLDTIPALVQNRPLVIQDVVMSKLHSAILTDDPISNLYVCGVGRGGRLGLGDENTQFKFTPLYGPFADKKVCQVALGQNHSMAVVGNGELWTWGLNSDSQLGYVLPPPLRTDEEPMSLVPRQVFGPLKKEIVLGIAASSIHSVAHTGSSLYCWGRNAGQLALMDSDSRSLDLQQTPRKVAASLLSAPIEMVAAIDRATTCLLSNRQVWVFTNYGYNLIRFPFPDAVLNRSLNASVFSTKFDVSRRDIRYIAAGGETIAAVTARGDLFTMQVSNKGDAGAPFGSTTNPVKIKSAVSQPQCIWDSGKDGVTSVSVGEHGSVIICTASGAVWRRIKRLKGKIESLVDSGDARRKDFKFQRVPYITDCVAVRSSTFGAFAAIRKDSKVMAQEIHIAEQNLWNDMGSLLCLKDFYAPESSSESDSSRKAWNTSIIREGPGTVAHRILSSSDIETDMLHWIQANSFLYDTDLEIRTNAAPDIRIPVHGWLLSGRSSILRTALSDFRLDGFHTQSDAFVIEAVDDKMVLTLLHVDVFTMLNVVVYAYQDNIVPVWKYTREAPALAHRFRQVRTDLMKVATKLNMPKLEAAARLQAGLERTLDADLQEAITDPVFFEDGDVILELDGDEVTVHSHLLCQRCPFFDGMFNGRSQGQWLAGRRDATHQVEPVRIDLKHIHPETFSYVLNFLYGDVGEEIFDDVTATSIDEFSELVLDVLSVANELMIDRLSQICQSLIGKFVTNRNISNLLNEISTCSVAEFKNTGLEYICLQLESMLENHFLDSLDEELLYELDGKVRDNQLACFPIAKSGRAELLLHEKYPDLVADIEEERRRRVKEMAFKHAQREEERRLSSAYKPRFGSLDDPVRGLETPEKQARQSRRSRNEPFSPTLRPKDSHADMIFDMDDEGPSGGSSLISPQLSPPLTRTEIDVGSMPKHSMEWKSSKGKDKEEIAQSPVPSLPSHRQPIIDSVTPASKQVKHDVESPHSAANPPWASAALSTAKLDLKDIMSEASGKSALTAALSAQMTKDSASKPLSKMSQKERKKQMQMQLESQAAAQEEQAKAIPWEVASSKKAQPPWKAAPIPKTSLQQAMASDVAQRNAISTNAKPLVTSESNPQSTQRRTASPDTRFPGQGRPGNLQATPQTGPGVEKQQKKPLIPHSKSYIKPAQKTEPTLGLSMADIIGQQQREQQLIKEAVAKRSLQEIQQEQAFQEWWDQESRRAQEEEARRHSRAKGKEEQGGGRRGRRGRGGKARGNEPSNHQQPGVEGSNTSTKEVPKTGGNASRGRGRGKANKGGISLYSGANL
ncbi:uncharacterized protein TRIVIDRAFT_63891 [Trichoderma virens Gv29-8]|uniref:BTB domain-containing protein n=1 Tax=Hypocrea virens (strain Gv29-8 / FGSC 10586) TaxID=413071 RepID=G9MP89_HYPVG|nr:uncharacterized protein TRIVIDRAFT_63891 [Trichoderma virens Gv29-8]EHK23691.1 hypothetical protein TRIVIDRAFT_63891 [Trichoderma virens Gv29-8]